MIATPPPPPRLTGRFFAAAAFANEVHGGHRRLGTQIPYAAHRMIVAGLVLEDGGDETQAIAALLHDAVEDGGGRPVFDRIRAEFGAEVAAIVRACSDSLDPDDTRSWRERKTSYLAHLPDTTDEATLRVALADKVHNARSIIRDYRAEGHALWERFANKTLDDQLWYYRALVQFSAPATSDHSSRTSGAHSLNSRISQRTTAPRPERRTLPETLRWVVGC